MNEVRIKALLKKRLEAEGFHEVVVRRQAERGADVDAKFPASASAAVTRRPSPRPGRVSLASPQSKASCLVFCSVTTANSPVSALRLRVQPFSVA